MPGRQAGENVETLGDTLARMVAEALYDIKSSKVKDQTLSNTLAEVEAKVLVDAC